MAYKINWTAKGAYINSYDHVKTEDVIEVIGKLVSNPKFDSIEYILKDFRNISDFDLYEKPIFDFTITPSTWNPNIKSCFITQNKELQNIFNNFITFMEITKWDCKVFNSLEEAIEWCNRDKLLIPKNELKSLSKFKGRI